MAGGGEIVYFKQSSLAPTVIRLAVQTLFTNLPEALTASLIFKSLNLIIVVFFPSVKRNLVAVAVVNVTV